jgi:NAD+ synthase
LGQQGEERTQVAVARTVETGLPMIYVNQMCGQDELVFDGGSFGLNGDRTLAFQLPQFQAGLWLTHWERGEGGWRCLEGLKAELPGPQEAKWQACVLALRDYVEKNGFKGVVLGFPAGGFGDLRGHCSGCDRGGRGCAASCCRIATRLRRA